MLQRFLALGAALVGAASLAAQAPPPDFARELRPLLAGRCFACHGPDEEGRKGGLRLDRAEDAREALAPGEPGRSEVLRRISSADAEERMPPAEHAPALAPEEVALLRRWIEAGAPYAAHWAFEAPQRPAVASLVSSENALDALIGACLAGAGLTPNGRADARVLLRRLSLDLTGLPPSPEELARFEADPSRDAYAREVERLLASPAYAERWAAEWLDLARYADSAGFGSDPLRTIWRYRDWVIEAFEANLPYDRFTIEQLAGDLLPDATVEQQLATAFHRNTLTNTEGGTDDEEFRVAAVKDRASTTFQVWMGLTLGCAQCHTHKFDPISQREFYAVYAMFDQTADRDRGDEAPLLATPTREQVLARRALEEELSSLRSSFTDTAGESSAWRPLPWSSIAGERGTAYERDGEAGFLASGPLVERERTTLRARVPEGGFGALRLVLLPTAETGALSRDGKNGNIVLSELEVFVRFERSALPRVQRVRVSVPGAERMVHLAELELFAGGENLARRGRARQSSTAFGGAAARAIDGNTSGRYEDESCSHTSVERDPWWEVELESEIALERLLLWNRSDGDLERRHDGLLIEGFDARGELTWSTALRRSSEASYAFDLVDGATPLPLLGARADHEQKGWSAEAAIDGDPSTGWALAPRQREEHALELELDAPWLASGERELEIQLDQLYGARHVIARARLEHRAPRTPEQRLLAQRERELQRELDRLEVVRTPVMQELPADQRRTTRVLEKGNFLTPGEVVEPGVPAAFHPFPPEAPKNRLGLARWIVDPRNPLTARVAVNRYWARLFGRGLVETEEDFGVQGSFPTHRELLDHLALAFVESGWDVKGLLRILVHSETYRRSSDATPEQLARDPRNLLYARGPRFRLSAEMVRDQVLSISGLLSRKRFGPSVFPPQPEGLWQAAFNGERTWQASTGEDRHRRALYTFLRRTIPYPSMALFDAPSRELCTPRRFRTNTPLQALVTLNDPVYVEAAAALATRLIAAELDGDDARCALAFELATAERPRRAELDALRALLAEARATGEGEPSAWTSVAAVVLNLEAALVKR
ncbi:MAG: DUF1553 domain-containing protein [Planctomycetes bacterium]|nr:DUF1553 domain-containing protein [Planctomycetota bacterium]